MLPIIQHVGQQRRHRWRTKEKRFLDSPGEGEGGMISENNTETSTLPYVK